MSLLAKAKTSKISEYLREMHCQEVPIFFHCATSERFLQNKSCFLPAQVQMMLPGHLCTLYHYGCRDISLDKQTGMWDMIL